MSTVALRLYVIRMAHGAWERMEDRSALDSCHPHPIRLYQVGLRDGRERQVREVECFLAPYWFSFWPAFPAAFPAFYFLR